MATLKGYRIYGGDAKDAYAHSPPPSVPTYVSIDDQYADWYKWKYGVDIDRKMVLPVQHALQGHPESGKLWEHTINKVLASPELGFKSTVHDKTIYTTVFKGVKIYLLRQVDDFALACPDESFAAEIYEIIGQKLTLPGEKKAPFSNLGLLDDFNGVSIEQSATNIALQADGYIDRVLMTHGWQNPTSKERPAGNRSVPFPPEILPALYKAIGPREGTPEHRALSDKKGFGYRQLLGELMFAYVTCRPDIGYHLTTLSKFSLHPADVHYDMLKQVAKYLRQTKTWGIIYSRDSVDNGLPKAQRVPSEVHDENLPPLPRPTAPTQLVGFVDAAHANDLRTRRSTTGYAFILANGIVSYRSKTQSITATSSTEAEFLAAVLSAKQAKYLRAILKELGFPQKCPTPLYEDNMSAINMINNKVPTERSRHIDIQHFAIQDWRENGDILMKHIPGIINPPDDLTKPLGWILHSRHARRMMGHFKV